MKTFEVLWCDLTSQLRPRKVVKNWTAFRGYLGDTMKIVGVGDRYIQIEAPNAKTIQQVPKGDFQKVCDVWKDYQSQRFARSAMREITLYSKYIISILHWYEENASNE
jgi:hypothetical protein